MTTNHKARLDPALIRPGRADVHLYQGNATHAQMARMYQKFYPEAPAEWAERYARAHAEGIVSMAALQARFLEHPNDAEGALQKAESVPALPFPSHTL